MGDKFTSVAFWIIFGCTVVTLGDVVYKWFTKVSSISESTKSVNSTKPQKASNPSQIAAPERL
jgi:hypothetical protein